MALNTWQFVYADNNFVPQGELFNAADRTISLALSKIDTASFSVRTDHPLADQLIELEGFLKVYRNGVLLFYGPFVDAEETVSGDSARVTVNAASPAWILQHRWGEFGAGPATFAAGAPRGAVALALISLANSQYYNYAEWPSGFGGYATDINTPDKMRQTGHTMVSGDTSTQGYPSVFSGGTLAANWTIPAFKPIMENIQDLAAGTAGFDWRFMPVENFVNGAWNGRGAIAECYFDDPIGAPAPEAIFEFGDGKLNVKSYTRTMSRASQANSVRHLINGTPQVSPPYAFDNPSKAKWSVMEDLAQAELTDVALRTTLVNEHVLVRKNPRNTIVFEPTADYGTGRLPSYGTDYNIGDIVTCRAVSVGSQRFNALFRVWGVEFSVDNLGVEIPKLTLSEQGA